MSQLPGREEIAPKDNAGSPAAGLVVWTIGQLLALAVVWADMRLSSNHTAGQFGLQLLLSAQIVLSAALVSLVARAVRPAVIAFAVGFPVTQLAGWRCSAGGANSLLCSAALFLWLGALTCWMRTTRGEQSKTILTVALLLWVAGTPLLAYFAAEFVPGSSLPRVLAHASPLLMMQAKGPLLLLLAGHAAIAAMFAWLARGWRHA